MRRSFRGAAVALLAAAAMAEPSAAFAHEAEHTAVAFRFARDGSFVLDVTNDPNWLLLRLESFVAMEGGAAPTPAGRLSDQERDARLRALGSLFIDRIVIWVDGHEVRPESVEYVPPQTQTPQDLLQPMAVYRLRGHVSPDALSMRWYYGMVADAYPVTIARADGRSMTDMIVTGDAWSRALDLSGQFSMSSRWELVREYFVRGCQSVVPDGAGFVLFLLGLLLLRLERRTVVRQVAAFTAAHSAALWLVAITAITMPPRVIGAAIAVSVVYVAVENLATRELKPWRLALVVVFGLAHGAALADRFGVVPAPAGQSIAALTAFHAGVEAAALSVVAFAALVALSLASRRPVSRSLKF